MCYTISIELSNWNSLRREGRAFWRIAGSVVASIGTDKMGGAEWIGESGVKGSDKRDRCTNALIARKGKLLRY
jgi:hypothetical protein